MSARDQLEIAPVAVRELIERAESGIVLIDCRTEHEQGVARIAGARLLPLHRWPDAIDELDLEPSDTPIIYCHHGVRSLRAATMLRSLGFEHARSMRGGIDAWSVEIDPGVPRY